jgi:hypothetical protein
MKLYLYCVVGAGELMPTGVEGVMGKALTACPFDSLAVVTSEFDGDLVPISRENVLKHSSVINSVLDQSTPLPFRFGTVVDESKLRNFMTARHEALVERLSQIQGYLEMSVKIIWDPSSFESLDGQKEVAGPGTAFLEEKRRELKANDGRVKQAQELSADLARRIESLSKEEHVSLRPNEKLVLAGSHLVKRGSILEYRENLAKFAQERTDLRFLVSGPWAPYSFANIDLEFKTHFGVS